MKTAERGSTTARRHATVARKGHPRSIPTFEPEDEVAVAVEQPFVEGVRDEMGPDLRHRLISEAAYRLYEERGFADGYDVDDWLQAEEAVDHQLLGRPSGREGGGGT